MKRFVYGMLTLAMTGAFAASPVTAKISPDKEWKSDAAAPGSWSIDYPGKGWPGINATFPAKAGAFYRVTFEARADEPKQRFVLKVPDHHFEFEATKDFTPCAFYFYANADAEQTARVYFNPNPGPAKAQIRNFKVESLSEGDLAENLFPNGDFEADIDPRGAFGRGWQNPEFYAEIVPSPNFLYGTKSLALLPPQGEKATLYSIYLPAIPKRKIELKFWAKADSPQVLNSWLDFQQHGQTKHLYDRRQNKLTTEWQEFTQTYEVPSIEEHPTLRTHTVRLLFLRLNAPGNIYIDNIEYRILN